MDVDGDEGLGADLSTRLRQVMAAVNVSWEDGGADRKVAAAANEALTEILRVFATATAPQRGGRVVSGE